MATTIPRALIAIKYAEAAQAYLRSLPPEHFMEATAQATQREISLESFALIKAQRPEIHMFNELLVQYPYRREKKPHQVVPDNMVVVWKGEIKAETSYDVPLQPVPPLLVMEYVSRHSKRKDYEESFHKYERELKVLYYLLFYPEDQELTLYHHTGRKYISVKPNEQGRYAIPELELEFALLDGWVRYWYQGDLLPLPAELQRQLNDTRRQLEQERQRANQERQRADQEREGRLAAERELEILRAQLRESQTRLNDR
jgi:Uma2 family endonuclease